MGKVIGKLTFYFEKPFWVGFFERWEDGRLAVCKFTFGAEPKDAEIYDFILHNYNNLKFSSAVESDIKDKKINPKRMQREVKKQLQNRGIGTKSQQALQLQVQQNKLEHKQNNRNKQQQDKQRKFLLKQQKRKDKHRGH